ISGTVAVSSTHASFTTTAQQLAAGSHSMTVVYSGDVNFNGGTSAVLTQTVNKSPVTAVVGSSLNPSVFNQSVMFTPTVTANIVAGGTPGGTVTFMDGAVSLGSKALASGSATLAIATLAAGSHSITVGYGGAANFAANTSAVLTQTVNKAATTTTLSV